MKIFNNAQTYAHPQKQQKPKSNRRKIMPDSTQRDGKAHDWLELNTPVHLKSQENYPSLNQATMFNYRKLKMYLKNT